MTFNVAIDSLYKANALNVAIVSFTLAYIRICARTGTPFVFMECYHDFLVAHDLKDSELNYRKFRDRFLYWSTKSKIKASLPNLSHERILTVIQSIRESFVGSVTVYTQGSCWYFYNILKQVFDNYNVEPYQDLGFHVVAKIEGKCYDINGEVRRECHPLDMEEQKRLQNQKFIMQWKRKDSTPTM